MQHKSRDQTMKKMPSTKKNWWFLTNSWVLEVSVGVLQEGSMLIRCPKFLKILDAYFDVE